MMNCEQEEVCDRRRILNDLSRCLKTVYMLSSSAVNNSVPLSSTCPLIQCVDRSLHHGLLNLMRSYWPLVQSYCHAQTLQTIDSWVGYQGSHRAKGQAWILATMIEGSFQSYLQCILAEPHAISQFYAPHAILRDPSSVSQLSSLFTGLESINFLPSKNTEFNQETSNSHGLEDKSTSACMRQFLELAFDGGPTLSATTMTSSMNSSLASPVDSGFTQLDSETDTASFSEIVFEADPSSLNEEIAVLPIDSCTEKSLKSTFTVERMTISDIANANTSLDHSCVKSDAQKELVESVVCPYPSDFDGVIHRRPKTQADKVPSVKQQKRVSFHENTSHEDSDQNNFTKRSNSVAFISCNSSLVVGDLSTLEHELELVDIGNASSLPCENGMEKIFVKNIANPYSPIDNSANCTKAPVTERGIPEGQEDPLSRCSTSVCDLSRVILTSDCHPLSTWTQSQMSLNSSPSPSLSSLRPQVSTPRRVTCGSKTPLAGVSSACMTNVLSQTPSKACLVNRFLRSLTEKKLSNCRAAVALAAINKRELSKRKLDIYINGVKPNSKLSQELLDELKEEMNHAPIRSVPHTNRLSINITSTLDSVLRSLLELMPNLQILKVLKVRDNKLDDNGQRTPLLAVLTNQALYTIGRKLIVQAIRLFQVSYILVGVNAQWVSLVCKEKSPQLNLLIGDSDCTSELISSIELALRCGGKKSFELPGIKCLAPEDLAIMPYWRRIVQDEEVCHFSVVHAVEMEAPLDSPLEPEMKAHFMFRTCKSGIFCSWQPGFFMLRSGVLYVSLDEAQTSPHHDVDMLGLKVRLVALASRPHVIEVSLLQIAAPDDNVAHEWLHSLQRASAGVSDGSFVGQKCNIVSGSLVLTEKRLMLINSLYIPKEQVEKSDKLLLAAFVSDVTSLRFGDTNSSWCVVEFSCREVYESGGDFIIFFSTSQQMLTFKNRLCALNPDLVKNTGILPFTEPLQRRCYNISTYLSNSWNFVPLEKY